MTAQDRETPSTSRGAQDQHSEQEVIEQTGDVGAVETHGGATSLGTTPIGLGSVGPVQQHQQATDMIMGQSDAAGAAATAAGTGNRGMQTRATSRPVGRTTQGGLSGILEKIKAIFKKR